MSTIYDIITLAKAQLGNDGSRYWNWYTDSVNPAQGYYVNGNVTPYCAEFISWLLAKCHIRCYHFPNSVAFDAGDIPPNLRISKHLLKAGDLLAYDWDKDTKGDHVGLVIESGLSYIRTIEGNTSGGIVREMTRDYSDILFGIRPDYEEDDIVTDTDIKNVAKEVVRMLTEKQADGHSVISREVWSAKNPKLEKEDTYQILRDIRTALGIEDGQMLPTQADREHAISSHDSFIYEILETVKS